MQSERIQRRLERLLEGVESAADDGDWDLVARSARRVLAVDQDNQDAQHYLAMAAEEAGQSDSDSHERASAGTTGPAFASTETPQPTSFAGGRYKVQKFLGEGRRGCPRRHRRGCPGPRPHAVPTARS